MKVTKERQEFVGRYRPQWCGTKWDSIEAREEAIGAMGDAPWAPSAVRLAAIVARLVHFGYIATAEEVRAWQARYCAEVFED